MSEQIRTRYAPSPTGFLHVGGLRTALYNYLFARGHGGKLLLRIEDTDRARLVEGAVENFLDVFNWLGIEFDEGPGLGGEFDPYVQSKRLDIYHEHVRKLAQQGRAYPCFCTPERLQEMRAGQQARGVPPMYDRTCRSLSADEARERVEAGESHVWRMAVPDHQTIEISDLIRGDVAFESSTIDDQVLVKSDGYPTYHLANVVDDHLMEITHVIRGEEWLPSMPKHVLLYRFLGWDLPKFAHLPLLLNPDRSKMSKRSGDVAVEAYRGKGILPEALINFVALLGWHPSDEQEIFSLADLVEAFSLERVNKAGAVFDADKLRWMNTEYIKSESDAQLFSHVEPLLEDVLNRDTRARVEFAAATLRGGADCYQALADKINETMGSLPDPEPEMLALFENESALPFLTEFTETMASWDADGWDSFDSLANHFKENAKRLGKAHGLKGKALWMTLRAGLTGQPHGPELPKLIGIWGRERALKELQASLNRMRAAVSE